MENLIKQMSKVKPPGARYENKEETESIRNRKIPLQKTQSFKGAKNGQNWFRRQFSGDLSRDYDSMDGGEYPTAVAAAAFAITSIEESHTPAPVKMREGPTTSLNKIKSKADDRTTPATDQPRSATKKFSDAKMEGPDKRVSFSFDVEDKLPDKAIPPVTSIKRTKTSADKQSELEYGETEKPVDAPPSIKKTGTFEKPLDRTASRKSEIVMPKPERPPTIQPSEITRQSSTPPAYGGSKANIWQRSEMAKIKERYEKLNTKILQWENKKKTKASNKMVMIEGELEKQRARAQQNYRSKVKTIEQVAGGARAQAEENRRNEEFKAKEKANKIRSTGKLPSTCFCF